MNAKRLAQLFREQARVANEIARELEDDDDLPAPKRSRARRPVRKITDLDMQDARNRLRKLGVAV